MYNNVIVPVESDVKTTGEKPVDLNTQLNTVRQELEMVRERGKLIAAELDLFRQRRVVYWADRFLNQFDAWHTMHPNFQQLKDDTILFGNYFTGFRLQPSISLIRVPFLSYKIHLTQPYLKAILLAPIMDIPLERGEIFICIIADSGKLIATGVVPVSSIKEVSPIRFDFAPIAASNQCELTINIFVQGVDAPVRIFELRKYEWWGLGKSKSKLFAGFIFA